MLAVIGSGGTDLDAIGMSEEKAGGVLVLVPVAERRHDLPARTTSAALLRRGALSSQAPLVHVAE